MEHVHGWTADCPGKATGGRTRRKGTGKMREKTINKKYKYSGTPLYFNKGHL